MAGKWPYKRVEEIALKIAMGPFGSSIKVETFTDSGIPIISGQHLRETQVTDGNFNFITGAHADSLKNANVQRGDVIFTHAGNIGQVAFIPDNSAYQRYVISQRQFYLRCNTGLMLPEFITYYFKTPEGQHRLLANANQVGVPSIARPSSYLKTIEVPVPSIEEQQVVVQNIKALDAKIRLNIGINQTLEAMAQAIFKSWFVDFDPVKTKIAAKQEGRDPLRAAMSAISGKPDAELDALQPEQYDPLAATAAMFPDEMEESELGEIPKGWAAGTIGDLAAVTIGGDWGKDQPENEQYVQAACLRGVDLEHLRTSGDCPKAPIRWVKKASIEKRLIQSTDLLIGGSGAGPCGRPLYASPLLAGLVDYPVIYSNFVKRFRCKSSSQAIYLDSILWSMFDGGAIENYINGTSVPNLNDKGLVTHSILLPDNRVLKEFEKASDNWLRRLYSSESSTLAVLRDALLPKLLSGELSVVEAMEGAGA